MALLGAGIAAGAGLLGNTIGSTVPGLIAGKNAAADRAAREYAFTSQGLPSFMAYQNSPQIPKTIQHFGGTNYGQVGYNGRIGNFDNRQAQQNMGLYQSNLDKSTPMQPGNSAPPPYTESLTPSQNSLTPPDFGQLYPDRPIEDIKRMYYSRS